MISEFQPHMKYEDYAAEWMKEQARYPSLPRSRARIRGRELRDALTSLSRETGDSRFKAAAAALGELNLVDEQGNWRRRTVRHDPESLIYEKPEYVLDWVQSTLKRGSSLRLALAYVAAQWGEPAVSFDAAVKRIERIYRGAQRRMELDRT